MSKSRLFFGGTPTGPEIQILMDAMPSWGWKQGEVLPYSTIEDAAQLTRKTTRFRTVLMAWRKRLLREMNIDVEAVPGEGLLWLLEGQRLRVGVRDYGRHVRGQRKASQRVLRTKCELLSEADQKRAEHTRRLMETSWATSNSYAKEIAMHFAPVKALPRSNLKAVPTE